MNCKLAHILVCAFPYSLLSCLNTNAHAQICFSNSILSGQENGNSSVFSIDVNNDGMIDILTTSELNDTVAVYINDGQADPTFSRVVVTSIANGAKSVFGCDIDGDGDIDILSASILDDTIAWYENDGAPVPGFTPHTITNLADGAISVFAADLDNDGDLDVMSASENDDTIGWYENDGAKPANFSTRKVVTSSANGASSVYAADLDNDGDIDILSAAALDFEIAWYENPGGPNPLFMPRSVSTTQNRPRSVFAADLDNDGHIDILSASTSENKVVWFPNSGSPNPTFTTERLVSSELKGPQSIYATDMDNDGDIDVVAAAISGDTISWMANDGGAFPQFTTYIIQTHADGAVGVYADDIDNDGDVDIISCWTLSDVVAWHENERILNETTGLSFSRSSLAMAAASNGDVLSTEEIMFEDKCNESINYFGKSVDFQSRGQIERSFLTTTVMADGAILESAPGQPVDVFGALTVPPGATSSILGSPVTITGPLNVIANSTLMLGPDFVMKGFPNMGERVITTLDRGARSVTNGDIDNDGDLDIISANELDDEIAWYENDGGLSPMFAHHSIASPNGPTGLVDGASWVITGDLDNDGDLDVVSASIHDDTIAWYENDGNTVPNFSKWVITSSADGARSVFAADLDSDGDLDIMSASANDNTIAWYENIGGNPTTFGPRIVVSSSANAASSVFAADLDNDGDIDILSAAESSFEIAWYENDGNPDPVFVYQSISTTQNRPQGVFAIDLDNDGDIDVLSASTNEDKVVWFQNDGAIEPSFTEQLITTELDGPESIYAADIDNDGDIDVIAAAIVGDSFAWMENDGGFVPTFNTRLLDNNSDAARAVSVADLDNDGDLDVLAVATSDNKLSWFQNGMIKEINVSAPGASIEAPNTMQLINKDLNLGATAQLISGVSITVDDTSIIRGDGALAASTISVGGMIIPELGGDLSISGLYEHFYNDPIRGLHAGTLKTDLLSDGTPSLLAVSGPAKLGGGLLVTSPPEFTPNAGQMLPAILTASTFDPLFPRFDLVHAPILNMNDNGAVVQGTLVASYSDNGEPGVVSLIAIPLQDLFFNSTEFDVAGKPNDAVLGDLSGGPVGEPDGIPDLVVAIPSIDGIAPNGAIAVFFGSLLVEDFAFDSLAIYQSPLVDTPIAVEVGDFNNDGTPDIAYANRGDHGINNDIHFLQANSSSPTPITPSTIIPISLSPGARATDLTVGEVLPIGFQIDDLIVGVHNAAQSIVMASEYNTGAVNWESCSVDVDDIDSLESFGSSVEGGFAFDDILVASSPSTGTVRIFKLTLGFDLEDATFIDVATGDRPRDISVGLLDGDGFPDIAVMCEGSNSSQGVLTLIRGQGNTFASPINIPITSNPEIPPTPTSLTLADIDSDTDLDLVIASVNESGQQSVRQLRNTSADSGISGLSFAAAEDMPNQPAAAPLIVVAGDLDMNNQGIPDDIIVLINPNGGQLRNGIPNKNLIQLSPGKEPSCIADLNGDGFLDFLDISIFLTAFSKQDPIVDLNNDGSFDFLDISLFLSTFTSGCP